MIAAGPLETPTAVLAWVRASCPEIVGFYDYATPGKDQGLPDVVVELEAYRSTSQGDPRFPFAQLQQTLIEVHDLVVSIMVDSQAAADAAHLLRALSQRLLRAALSDASLGGRVMMCAQQIDADFVPQFVVYEDGTEGRQVQIRMAVANTLIEE